MKKSNSILKVVLVMSLALNLLVVGSLAGFFGSGRHKDLRTGNHPAAEAKPNRGGGTFLGPIGRGLDRQQRRELGRAIQAAQRQIAGAPSENREAFKLAVTQALIADPFDPAVIRTLFGQSRVQLNQRLDISQDVLMQKLTDMTAAERAALAEKMQRPRRR